MLTLNTVSLKEAALSYVSMGWPVLPLAVKDKVPLKGTRGLLDATKDPDYVEWWWAKEPEYNIGLVTGVAFDALDLDGTSAVDAFYNMHPGYQHQGPVQGTGKGYHLLFAPTGSGNHARINEMSIDYRGTRGYIVAAPSLHPRGHRYQWLRETDELPILPDWLRPLVFPVKAVSKTGGRQPDHIKEKLALEKDIVSIFRELGKDPKPFGSSKMVISCPFHPNDDTPSLVLYLKTNSFYCFGCDAYGDPLNIRKWQRTGELH